MPLYFFHLSCGDRVCRDQEGVELPSRSAARAEASAIIHDLSRSQAERNRWAGWLLRVEDEAGQFFCLPIDRPGLALVSNERPTEPRPKADRPIEEVAAELGRRTSELNRLLERHQQLREALRSELLFSIQARIRACELLDSCRPAEADKGRERMADLLERNRRLREELASEWRARA